MILGDLLNATSSRGSVDGQEPCKLQDGQKKGQSGLEAALASHSAQPESRQENQMKDTSGRPLQNLSPSASLMLSLASRLKARLSTGGSMIYRQTWKEKITAGSAVLGAPSVGAPHIRQRLYWVANFGKPGLEKLPWDGDRIHEQGRSTR